MKRPCNAPVTIEGWSMGCGCHTYVTLFFNGKFVCCFDNDLYNENPLKDKYYAEHIIAAIEKRTGMKITDIPIVGTIEDFDGLRFLNCGFKKGADWLNKEKSADGIAVPNSGA